MHAKISPDFWSDPGIESLTAHQRLAALWLMTSSRTSIFGFVSVTPRRFEFETGSPYLALEELAEALPKAFERVGDGIWIRNFIGYQIGRGNALISNNMSRPLLKELRACEGLPVVSRVLSEYPELREPYQEKFRDQSSSEIHSPSEGLDKPSEVLHKHKSRAEQSREEQSGVVQNGEGICESAIPQALFRARSLFRMRIETPLDSSQDRAWKKNRAAVEATTMEDWLLLEWYFAQGGEIEQYRRKDLAQLLNNWNGELDRARTASRKSPALLQKKETAPEDPQGWKEMLVELFPDHFPDGISSASFPSSLRLLDRETRESVKSALAQRGGAQ